MTNSSPTFLGLNRTELSASFAVSGKRWEYTFDFPYHLDTISYLARRISSAKAFAYAKKRASQERQLA